MYVILIADEDRVSREFLTQVLALPDCRVFGVASGKSALQFLAMQHADVLISEAHLPDMHAWELIPKAQQLDRNLPVVVVTNDDSWETSKRIRIDGAPVFFYGLKPLNYREILQVVHCALRQHDRFSGSSPHVGVFCQEGITTT